MKTFLFTILFLICIFITSQHVIDAQGNFQDNDPADYVNDPFLNADISQNANTQNVNRAQNANVADANIGAVDDEECQTIEDINHEHDGSLFLNYQDQEQDYLPPVQEPQQVTKDYLSGIVEVCLDAKDNIGAGDSEYQDNKHEHDGSLFLSRQDQEQDYVPPVQEQDYLPLVQEPQQITKDYLSGNVEVCAEAKDNIGAASDSEYHQTIEDIKHEHDGSLFLMESVPAREHPKVKRDYMGADRANKAVQDQRPIHDVKAEQPNAEIIRNTMKNTAGRIPNVADIL